MGADAQDLGVDAHGNADSSSDDEIPEQEILEIESMEANVMKPEGKSSELQCSTIPEQNHKDSTHIVPETVTEEQIGETLEDKHDMDLDSTPGDEVTNQETLMTDVAESDFRILEDMFSELSFNVTGNRPSVGVKTDADTLVSYDGHNLHNVTDNEIATVNSSLGGISSMPIHRMIAELSFL